MEWTHDILYFFGGITGRPFQTPFAKPSGEALLTSTVHVLWGFFNLVFGYVLVCRVGRFDLLSTGHVAALLLGGLLISLFWARHFGRFHGGNAPGRS